MLKILVCTRQNDRFIALSQVIQNLVKSEVVFAQHKEDVGKNLLAYAFDMLVVDIPFVGDHHEMSYVSALHERYPDICILLLVAQKYSYQIQEKVEKTGIYIVSKPIQKEILRQFLSFVHAYSYRVQLYQQKQKRLLNQIAEIKQVNLAKCLLMENEYMSETKAHRFIEKEAMDLRITKSEVAKKIIDKYQNISS